MEEKTLSLGKKSLQMESLNIGKNSGEDGVENLLKNKKIRVYFVQKIVQGWEIQSLKSSYALFREKTNAELGFDFLPVNPDSIIQLGNNPQLTLNVEQAILNELKKDDDTIYFFFFHSDSVSDHRFLHPEESRVKALPIDKLDELYQLGKEAIDDINKAS